MAIKEIVLHQGSDARSDARLEGAVAFARRHEARIIGVYSLSYPEITAYWQAEIGADLLEQRMIQLSEQGEKSGQAFQALLDREGIPGEWRMVQGRAAAAMALSMRYADLSIVGQANPDAPTMEDTLADELVLSAGRPVLVWPYVGSYPTCGERIMVAWNGTREAVRAVHDAMPLLERARLVTVCTINPEGTEHVAGADMATHLSRHGVIAEAHHVTAPDMRVGESLLSALADFSADLLVMGGYGHSRIRELALGGATRHLLQSMTVPVLMSH